MTIDEIKQALRETKELCANIQTCKECPLADRGFCFTATTNIENDPDGPEYTVTISTPCPENWWTAWNGDEHEDHHYQPNATDPLTMNDYQRMARRTAGDKRKSDKMEEALFGLAGEVGELCDHYKKYMHQGHDLDYDKMAEEAGDVMWYLAEIADALGVTLEDIARRNIDKLRKRYPNGFDPERSRNRGEERYEN